MSKTLFVVRHGETVDNVKGIFQGHRSTPLNSAGYAQAQNTGEILQQEPIGAVYSSPLKRATSTADVICEYLDTGYSIAPELIEKSMGKLEGLTWEEAKQRHGDTLPGRREDLYDYTPYGGDSPINAYLAVGELLDEVAQTQGVQTALFVTHSSVIRAIYTILKVKQNEAITHGLIHKFEI